MWCIIVLSVNLFVSAVITLPAQNDIITKSFQAAVNHQNLQTILTSIEERLRNLDNIYSMHLSPTLNDKLEQYHRKLEAIDTKISRLESLVMLNLDKIAENISTKNFKDDIYKTSLVKKMDSIYEGLSHRINYLDRKFESNLNKAQTKTESSFSRLEKMEIVLTKRNDDIEEELSDVFAAMDNLKTGCSMVEENIVNNTNENFEIALNEQTNLIKSYNDKTNKIIETLFNSTAKIIQSAEKRIVHNVQLMNETGEYLKTMKSELKGELNEYAIKVAEMNSENWKTGKIINEKQDFLENLVNVTKRDFDNGLRALMVLVGKISKDFMPQDQIPLEKLSEKLDSNFEKVFSAQNIFMDSCYRLQIDESQIESKISDILEKLMETFEKKTAIELKDIKNLEKLIKGHDVHARRNMIQINKNIATIFETFTKAHQQFDFELKQVNDHLNILFSLLEGANIDVNGSTADKTFILNTIKEMEQKLISINKQKAELTLDNLRAVLFDLQSQNSTDLINAYMKNMSQIMLQIETKVNKIYSCNGNNSDQQLRFEAINLNFTKKLNQLITVINQNHKNISLLANNSEQEMLSEINAQTITHTNQTELTDILTENSTNTMDDKTGKDFDLSDEKPLNKTENNSHTTLTPLWESNEVNVIEEEKNFLKNKVKIEMEKTAMSEE